MFRSSTIILQLVSVCNKTLQRYTALRSVVTVMIILEFYLMFRPTCDIKYSMVTYNFKGLKRKVTDKKLANGRSSLTLFILMDTVVPWAFPISLDVHNFNLI